MEGSSATPGVWLSPKLNPMTTPDLSAAASPASSRGDWLLTFGDENIRWPTRHPGGEWQEHHRAGEGILWTQAPSEDWRGAPWAVHDEGDWTVWLFGETYPLTSNGDEAWRGIPSGRNKPTELNGHCLLLAWHRPSSEWHVWTDRFGTLHAYHAGGATARAVGTCFTTVAGASRRQLDWPGLTGYCGFGFFPQDRTWFEDVKILRPATHSVFAADGTQLRSERYWHWWFEPSSKLSYDETLAELHERLEAVIADQTGRGAVALPISGGLDSRCTVAALPSECGDVRAYTYGYLEDSREVEIARRIAAKRNLTCPNFSIKSYLFDEADDISRSLEGFSDLALCRQYAITSKLKNGGEIGSPRDFVIAAHWGDVWLDDMGLLDHPLDEEALLAHVMDRISKPAGWLLDHLCRPNLGGEDPGQLLRQMVREELAPFEEIEDADFRVKAFKTDQWSFRSTTASLRAYQPGVFPRLPFYDTRLTDFFATVPTDWTRGRQLQIDYLKRYAPDLARITWDAYDTNLYRYPHFNTWLLPQRALRKAWRTITGYRPVQRNWEVQFDGEAGREGLRQWLTRPGLRIHDVVPRSDFEGLLEEFSVPRPSGTLGYVVSKALTLAVALETHG